jgi:hypothetical protein
MEGHRTDKQSKVAAELEEIVKARTGAGDFAVAVQRDPNTGWRATINTRATSGGSLLQLMADAIITEWCQDYELSA